MEKGSMKDLPKFYLWLSTWCQTS